MLPFELLAVVETGAQLLQCSHIDEVALFDPLPVPALKFNEVPPPQGTNSWTVTVSCDEPRCILRSLLSNSSRICLVSPHRISNDTVLD
jgi:hypothetical protein